MQELFQKNIDIYHLMCMTVMIDMDPIKHITYFIFMKIMFYLLEISLRFSLPDLRVFTFLLFFFFDFFCIFLRLSYFLQFDSSHYLLLWLAVLPLADKFTLSDTLPPFDVLFNLLFQFLFVVGWVDMLTDDFFADPLVLLLYLL